MIILDKKYSSINSHVKYFSLKIKCIFKSNGILDSNIGFLPFKFFQKILHINNSINTIELYMSDPFNANKIIINAAKKINTPLFLYTWINSYKYIYDDIKTTKIIIYLALSLLIIISCFNITSISLMTISKKTKEIAILRSMGANHFLIQLIFLYYGLRFIIIGSLIGIFLSIITILNFESITFFLEKNINNNFLSKNFYYSNFLLLKLNILDIVAVFISTMIIGFIINWYPAYYASQISPCKILKEY